MCYVKIPVHDIWMFMLWIVYFEQLLLRPDGFISMRPGNITLIIVLLGFVGINYASIVCQAKTK